MARKGLKPRIPWEDRYQTPSIAELRHQFNKQQWHLIELGREKLVALDAVTEDLVWQGIPWRWCFAYRSGGDPTRALAYLIPQPGKPQMAMPLTDELIAGLPLRRLSRTVRDGIVFASRVAGVHWAHWELTNRTLLDELLVVARARHDMLLQPAQ